MDAPWEDFVMRVERLEREVWQLKTTVGLQNIEIEALKERLRSLQQENAEAAKPFDVDLARRNAVL